MMLKPWKLAKFLQNLELATTIHISSATARPHLSGPVSRVFQGPKISLHTYHVAQEHLEYLLQAR